MLDGANNNNQKYMQPKTSCIFKLKPVYTFEIDLIYKHLAQINVDNMGMALTNNTTASKNIYRPSIGVALNKRKYTDRGTTGNMN